MPSKLKNLKIISTDLVDQGANPDAYVRLFKRNDDCCPKNNEKIFPRTNTTHPISDEKILLEKMQNVQKAQKKEIYELKKSLAVQKLSVFAQKYLILGKNPDKLALKLFHMKELGDCVYDDYVSLLDECLALIDNKSLFAEKGSDNCGIIDSIDRLDAAARKISENSSVNPAEAIVKAWDNNPELAAAYENEYRLGGNFNA